MFAIHLITIVGLSLMPSGSGHVSGRICHLKYARREESCIRLCSLNSSSNTIVEGEAISLANMDAKVRK